jgi:DHA1 family tetracycline resistance protein-like MFS transporter
VAGITGATNAVTATVIADITPPHQRAKRFGLLSACYGGGMIAGPAMGGLFGAISPHLPFLLAALLSASNLALTFILLRETRPDSPARSASLAQHRGRPGLSAVPGITFLLIAFGLVQFIGQAPGATWVLFTEHRLDWSPVEVGILPVRFRDRTGSRAGPPYWPHRGVDR